MNITIMNEKKTLKNKITGITVTILLASILVMSSSSNVFAMNHTIVNNTSFTTFGGQDIGDLESRRLVTMQYSIVENNSISALGGQDIGDLES